MAVYSININTTTESSNIKGYFGRQWCGKVAEDFFVFVSSSFFLISVREDDVRGSFQFFRGNFVRWRISNSTRLKKMQILICNDTSDFIVFFYFSWHNFQKDSFTFRQQTCDSPIVLCVKKYHASIADLGFKYHRTLISNIKK